MRFVGIRAASTLLVLSTVDNREEHCPRVSGALSLALTWDIVMATLLVQPYTLSRSGRRARAAKSCRRSSTFDAMWTCTPSS